MFDLIDRKFMCIYSLILKLYKLYQIINFLTQYGLNAYNFFFEKLYRFLEISQKTMLGMDLKGFVIV